MSRLKITGRTYSEATVQEILTNGAGREIAGFHSEEPRKA